MTKHKFENTSTNHYMFVKKYDNVEPIIILLYVVYMLIVRKDNKKIAALKKALSKSFALKYLGAIKKNIGMKIIRDYPKRMLWLPQEAYI